MNIENLKEIIKLINDSNIRFFEFEEESTKIKISKDSIVEEKTNTVKEIEEVEDEIIKEETIEVIENKNENVKSENIKEILSPMVGTFYSALSPNDEPLVRVGDRVKKGDVVCIIEAMKVMNEIESDIDGVVKEVLVKNDEMVQYGEKIIRIEEC